MTAAVAGAMRLSRTTVAQYLAANRKLTEILAAPRGNITILLRGEPVWDSDPVLPLSDGRAVRVEPAPSPLAVHEQILAHARDINPDPRVLVVITDVEEHDLDPAILARIHRAHIYVVDQWDIVRETFGAKDIDPMLRRITWVCEALLDASGARRWPAALAGDVLSRTPTLAALAARRLDLGDAGDRIDARTLLIWSQRPGHPQLLLDLRGPERAGLIEFLSETDQSGPTGRVLTTLAVNGHGDEAVAYGLLCAALWRHAEPSNPVFQARGRVERWLGDDFPIKGEALDSVLSSFGAVCEDYISDLLTRARTETDPGDEADEHARQARKITDTVLSRADALARQFGALEAAASSPILAVGLEARITAAGNALGRSRIDSIDRAITELRNHKLAPDHHVRIQRIRMAQRLSRWLATAPDPTIDTVAAAIDRQMRDTAWADRALDALEAGGDDDPAVRIAFQNIATKVRDVRREFDQEFATVLAHWTASGSAPGSMLTVETFLHRVVRPLAATRRVMLIVIDGMSSAIATELAGELRKSFAEYDPLPGDKHVRRRSMVAALPSLTAVSRTSLFAGALMKGDQKDEARLFPAHSFWGAKKAEVFHKHDLRSAAGDRFGTDLLDALADPDKHVAVVLNTIDDRLAKELKLDDSAWQTREVGDLRALVASAAARDMAVLLTSDHGHVIDRHGRACDGTGVASARHRVPTSAHDRLDDSEIALRGPRVVWPEPGASIVALWDADSRYTAQKAGYHGGASLAEMTIPVLAFLPFESDPGDWQELGSGQQPKWWIDDAEETLDVPEKEAVTERAKRASTKARELASDQITLDLVVPEAARPARQALGSTDALIKELLDSDTFAAQLETLARKPAAGKLEKAIRALLDGPQTTTALAQRIGELPSRARSFAAVLTQLLNVDGQQVLETHSDGRTLRLHVGLLREQFGLR